MKTIKFNGMVEGRRGGCSACGKRSSGRGGITTTKMFILPSGSRVMFRAGHTEVVTDKDAEFLLTYSYIDAKGNRRDAFEEV